MDFGDDDLECTITLMTPRGCNAFQIPPPATSRGHKAEDWRGKQIWKGQVAVLNKTKGEKSRCVIQLLNDDKTVFAECKIDDSYDKKIDRWYDSTRFFAILIENDKGQKANIGVGFVDRNDAFDFISSLDDYTRQVKREKGVEKYDVKDLEKDYSLKEGEKIQINIKGVTDKQSKPKPKAGGGLKKLAPPRGSKKPAGPTSGSMGGEDDEESKGLDDLFSDNAPQAQSSGSGGLLDF